MIPGIILYHYFVIQEEKSEEVNLDNLMNTIWTEAVHWCLLTNAYRLFIAVIPKSFKLVLN